MMEPHILMLESVESPVLLPEKYPPMSYIFVYPQMFDASNSSNPHK